MSLRKNLLSLQNSYGKQGSASADVGDTRRVSLGHEEKCDLQIVALDRQNSFSSSSTDYEEIDLSDKSYPDSGENDSNLDVDNPVSEDDFQSDSPKDDQEMDDKEDSDEGQSEDDAENDDNVKNDTVLTDEYDAENVLADEKVVDDNDIFTDEDDVENVSNDEDDDDDVVEREEVNRDSEGNSGNNSETLEDELLESDNEISISNDISITIANESLLANSDEHLEIVDDEVENNSDLNQGHESDSESVNENQLTSSQRIIVSQSDNEDENDSRIESKTEVLEKNHTSRSQVTEDKGNEREKSLVSSVTTNTSSEKVETEVLPAIKAKTKNVSKIEKSTDMQNVTVKSSQEGPKSTSKLLTEDKPGIAIASKLKNNKGVLPKEKMQEKDKETINDKGATQKFNKNVSVKAISQESKAKASKEKEATSLVTDLKSETENEEKMDFDQLSIEDEDSDFEEEEENLPAVKSKVGLNKIPSERPRRKRSNSRESNRKRRSYSPERSRTSSRSFHSQSVSRDRLRDQRLRDRSRERYGYRRSHSPSTDRAYSRKNYSHRQRSHSRDRKQDRISRDRENRNYRSRSRSNSRTRSGRTKKLVESNVDKQIKKENVKGSVKTDLESKDKVNTTVSSRSPRSPRKEVRTLDKSNKEKTVKVRETNSTTVKLIANGTKKVLKPAIQRDVDGVIIKQPKGLWNRYL